MQAGAQVGTGAVLQPLGFYLLLCSIHFLKKRRAGVLGNVRRRNRS